MAGFNKARHLIGLGAVAVALAAPPAFATAGYFALGYGALQRGQAGAGVANGEDAMSGATNPAGVATVGNEFSLGLQYFAPNRGYTGTGTYFVRSGTNDSGHPAFAVPNFAYNKVLANGARLNFAAYGNGGLNTSYSDAPNSNCDGAPGIFCGGKAGVNLSQLFLSFTYAQKVGNVAFGISPTIAVQDFSARGLGAFSSASIDPTKLTNNGGSWSHGFGLRGGVIVDMAPGLRLGISGQTKFNMTKFSKYSGLFADGGDFDIPASATVGVAWDATKDLTLMLDYQRIWYSGVPAVSNPFPNGVALGDVGGPGFGWKDVGVIKLGAAWKASPKMTWRFGYAYSTNPVQSSQVTLNILAPGVTRNHLSMGGSYQMSSRDQIDFSLEYVPTSSISGNEMTPMGATPGVVKLSMNQFAATIGWTRHF